MRRTVETQIQNERLIIDRRDRIIKAAITVFEDRGYHVATTMDIAREAGLTQSNLYNYVKSKQDVLFLVCQHLAQMYDNILNDVDSHYSDPLDRLVEAVKAIVNLISMYGNEVRLLYREIHALEELDRKSVQGMLSRVISRCESYVDKYELAYPPVCRINRRLSANLISFVPAVISLRSWDISSQDNEAIEKGVVEFILAGFGVVQPGNNRIQGIKKTPAANKKTTKAVSPNTATSTTGVLKRGKVVKK